MMAEKMRLLESVEIALAEDQSGNIRFIGRVTKGNRSMNEIFEDCLEVYEKETDAG